MGFRVFNNDNQVNLLTWTSLTPQREIQPDDIVVLTEDSTSGFHRGAGTQLYTTLSYLYDTTCTSSLGSLAGMLF